MRDEEVIAERIIRVEYANYAVTKRKLKNFRLAGLEPRPLRYLYSIIELASQLGASREIGS